jgi:lipopolysaccharide export LptBFGC system permease protein LptF
MRIYAKEGRAAIDGTRGVTFTLEKGHLANIDPAQPDRWVHTTFETYVLRIPLLSETQNTEKSLEEMDYNQLQAKMVELKQKGTPTAALACLVQLRWALSVTPLLFVALGIPLAIRVQRGGRSIGFAISLGVIVIYYVLIMGGSGLGQRGIWPAIPAVWLANVILLTTAVFFTKRFLKK